MHRALTVDEITELRRRGCRSRNWRMVEVRNPFRPEHYRNVLFSGSVKLGTTDEYTEIDGIEYDSGIYNATIHNCTVGDEVLIENVGQCISNYKIGRYAVIRNVGNVAFTAGATCGNGMIINALDEMGNMPIPVYERMSSQLAALFVIFRRDAALLADLAAIVGIEADTYAAETGEIGVDTSLTSCQNIRNVNIRDHAKVDGAASLANGTIGSRTYVGAGVVADNFIVQSDSRVENGVVLNHVLVGQGCRMANGFASHESMFFANCTMECGEADAVIAGPHSVSMHKSTLLIGSMMSFFNAGSGSNQSNHLYKCGPLHWGSFGRGCKLASDSYMLWPAHIGPFSMVSGRHYGHPDTSQLPFSYVVENEGDTFVVPAVALKSVGTFRDAMKWEGRDRRAGDPDDRIDIINARLLNPYTCGLIMTAMKTLALILEENEDEEICEYNGLKFKRPAIERGIDIYQRALDFYWGEVAFGDADAPSSKTGVEPWTDLGGQIVPLSVITRLKQQISAREKMHKIESTLRRASDDYSEMERNWVEACLNDVDRRKFAEVSDAAAQYLKEALLADAAKDLRMANPEITDEEIAEYPVVKQIKRFF